MAAPVTQVVPADGELPYTEDVFIGYRAWEKEGRTPSYAFGHGLGYTDWTYESIELGRGAGGAGTTATVRVRNSGARAGREVVQVYLAPVEADPGRPARWLAAFAGVEAGPGDSVDVVLEIPRRAFEIWDETTGTWVFVKGSYEVAASRSIIDRRVAATVNV
jgi:beta-glucosidase